jgi:hypothetical protein
MSLYLWHVEPDVFGFQVRVPERRANTVRIGARCFIPEKEGSWPIGVFCAEATEMPE